MDKEIFGKRLKETRTEKRMSLEELASKVGTSKTTLSKYERALREPKITIINSVADVLGVSVDWLIGYEDNESKDISHIYNNLETKRQQKVYSFAENQLKEQNKISEMPKFIDVLGQTAAGSALNYGDSDIEKKEFKTVPKGAQYALNVKGDSMEPLIQDGSIIFYKEQPNVENGEIAIVELEGDGVTCKKVYFNFDEDKIILRSLNEKYEDMELQDYQVRIIGKVVL